MSGLVVVPLIGICRFVFSGVISPKEIMIKLVNTGHLERSCEVECRHLWCLTGYARWEVFFRRRHLLRHVFSGASSISPQELPFFWDEIYLPMERAVSSLVYTPTIHKKEAARAESSLLC